MLSEISQLGQMKQKRFDDDAQVHITTLIDAVSYYTSNMTHLKFPAIHHSSSYIVGYFDVAFADDHDLPLQLGRIIFFIDD